MIKIFLHLAIILLNYHFLYAPVIDDLSNELLLTNNFSIISSEKTITFKLKMPSDPFLLTAAHTLLQTKNSNEIIHAFTFSRDSITSSTILPNSVKKIEKSLLKIKNTSINKTKISFYIITSKAVFSEDSFQTINSYIKESTLPDTTRITTGIISDEKGNPITLAPYPFLDQINTFNPDLPVLKKEMHNNHTCVIQ